MEQLAEYKALKLNDTFLTYRLRCAMVKSNVLNFEEKAFIPGDDLDSILDLNAVVAELEEAGKVPSEKLNYYANQICEVHNGKSPQDGQTTSTTRRRIFATLVLIDQTPAILKVIEEGLYDWDLPLSFDASDRIHPRLLRKGNGGEPDPVAFSQDWIFVHVQNFFDYQWRLLSPYIEMRTRECAEINHYLLDHNIILPFTHLSGSKKTSKIKIHPAHRNSLSSGSESFVLEEVWYGSEQVFLEEVDLFKRIGDGHHHITQLLATFRQGNDCYLLFPGAEGSLNDLFQKYPEINDPPRDDKLSKWLASQLLGLSRALASIHECKPDLDIFDSDKIRRRFGAHGHLNPQNILWFQENHADEDSSSLGTFKVSNFGLTSSPGLERLRRIAPKSISFTYRAPEYDVHGFVLPQYDMWSFGCILAELVTWYLAGRDAVINFKTAREKDATRGYKADSFFREVDGPRSDTTGKMSVRQHFDMLRNLPGCTNFLLELIEFVDKRLLQISPNDRCQTSELLEFADSVNKKCHEEISYCLERAKPLETDRE
ncbi:kinase-like domain-containing protein [Nemania abortiva]|nr:kinase-like domain-containing protein [Nemania abortiva]